MIFNTHAGHNPDGKVGCGAVSLLKESTENRRVNTELMRQLRALKHTVYDCTVDNGTSSSDVLSKIVAKCNAHTVDWDISIHFNAAANDKKGNGKTTGVEVYIYDINDTATKNKANAICNEISKLGFKNRGVKQRQDLYVIRKTKAKAMLIECCFVDDKDDVDLYNKLGVTKFVAAIVKGLTGQVLQESKPTTTTTTTTTTSKLYRVRKSKDDSKSQVGAYSSLDNAKNACQNAGPGYHVFDWDYKIVYSYVAPAPAKVTLSSIAITKAPTKTTYTVGDIYDGTGLTVTATYSDKSTKTISGYTVAGFDSSKAGTITITVTFEGKTATFKLTIKEKVVAPVEPKPEINVYDLDYKEKNLIILTTEPDSEGLKKDCAKAVKKILQNNAKFNWDIAKAFFKLAPIYKIDPMMAIAQSILETGWFKFEGSDAKASQNNFCGLGVTGGGVSGAAFNTIEDGVRAQLQHLYAYGCKDELPSGEKTLLDPRFHLVTRGIAPYWQQLAGRWAVPGYDKAKYDTPVKAMEAGNTYGQKIRTIYNQLAAVSVTDEDVIELFGEKEQEEPTNDNIVALIFECIKKLIEFLTTYLSKKDV